MSWAALMGAATYAYSANAQRNAALQSQAWSAAQYHEYIRTRRLAGMQACAPMRGNELQHVGTSFMGSLAALAPPRVEDSEFAALKVNARRRARTAWKNTEQRAMDGNYSEMRHAKPGA